jgi:hypothetical protein
MFITPKKKEKDPDVVLAEKNYTIKKPEPEPKIKSKLDPNALEF